MDFEKVMDILLTATGFPHEIWGSPQQRMQVKEVDNLKVRIYQIAEKDKLKINPDLYLFYEWV